MAFHANFGDLFLEDQPEAAFFGRLQGLSDPRRRFFQNQFTPTFNRFQGQLGSNIQAGQDPFAQQSFSSFLGGGSGLPGQGGFDFDRAFFQSPIRGRRTPGLTGNARFFGF